MNQIINSVPIWLSIIAINMTVIGLTSLADRKTIIGIDYSKYLLKSYKIFGAVRLFVLLVVFALVNILSIFVMFTTWYYLKMSFFLLLCISLVFAIYYFFGYILIENKHIRKEIYFSEMLGLYFFSEDRGDPTWYSYLHYGMPAKKSWYRSLSSNIISYFDDFNTDTIHDFSQVFGPESILYSQTRKDKEEINNYYREHFPIQTRVDNTKGTETPCKYITSRNGVVGKYISREFMDFIKESNIPDRWIGEIFRLFNDANKDVSKDVNELNFGIIMRCVAFDMYPKVGYLSQTHIARMLYEQMIFCADKEVWDKSIDRLFFIYLIHSLSENHDSSFKRFAEACMKRYIYEDKPANYYSSGMLRMIIDCQIEYGDNESLPSVYRVLNDFLRCSSIQIHSYLNSKEYSAFIKGYEDRYSS